MIEVLYALLLNGKANIFVNIIVNIFEYIFDCPTHLIGDLNAHPYEFVCPTQTAQTQEKKLIIARSDIMTLRS